MRRSGGLKELAVVVLLMALGGWLLRPGAAPPRPVKPMTAPSPLATPFQTSYAVLSEQQKQAWTLALRDLNEHAGEMPGCDFARSAQPPITPQGDGRKLYTNYCASCHGDNGKWDLHRPPPGPSARPPADLTEPGTYQYGSRELAIFRTARYGIPGTGMAPIDASDKELWAITCYVISLQKQPRPSGEGRGQ